jgi:uncharacterized protein
MSQHLATVQAIYEAFGRGDVAAILNQLADDVEWEVWQTNSAQQSWVPWMQARRGREAVAEFFAVVARFQFRKFDILNMAGSGDRVVVELEVDFEVPEGGAVRDEEIHLWVFDNGGKVRRFRHYLDTAKHISGAQGKDTRAQPAST